jgi:hypothetical protein
MPSVQLKKGLNMKTSHLCQAIFVAIMLACASRPYWLPAHAAASATHNTMEQNWAFNQWNPSQKDLYALPLSELEQSFANHFPGHIARFTDGNAVWVIRHTAKPTRMLHSAIDCYRGLGYKVSTQRVVEDTQLKRWRCFNATKGYALQVCERIVDNKGAQWTDVSAWYWENTFKQNNHEWWAITQVTAIEKTS